MQLHFLGGADEVGASCLLVEIGGQRLLIDAGVRVSPKVREGLSGELLPDLAPLSGAPPHAIIITHAHADHIGAIPLILGAQPQIPTYATPATCALMQVMLADALRIMDTRREQEGELPHYDEVQVQHLEKALKPLPFRTPFSLGGNVRAQFFRAGHIPGAASLYLESEEGSLLISGDLSFSPMRATPRAEFPNVRPDVLVIETTYGGKLHANRQAEEARLIEAITNITAQGGRVLIPAFALGRAQEVALILDAALASQRLPAIPIYMDGMTRAITTVFQQYPDYLSPELARHVEKNGSLWRSSGIRAIRSLAERETLAREPQPSVIIASSGMLTGGASPIYAAHIANEPGSAIFITGYQDEESPGKRLQKLAAQGGGTLQLGSKKVELQCQIGTYSLSAHADENELTQYATQLEPSQTYLVHGDGGARERMAQLLRERSLAVTLPRLGQNLSPSIITITAKRQPIARGVGVGLPLTGAGLWQKLIEAELARALLTPTQLGEFWFGDTPYDTTAFAALLQAHPLYFVPHWKQLGAYIIRGPHQVQEHRPRFAWLETLGGLRGQLLLLQDSDRQPLLAVGWGASGPTAQVITGRGGILGALAERVLLRLGEWEQPLPTEVDEKVIPELEQALHQATQALRAVVQAGPPPDQFAPFADGAAHPLGEIAAALQADYPDLSLAALLWQLAELNAKITYAQVTFTPDQGAASAKAKAAKVLDFVAARDRVAPLFPPESRLRRISADQTQRILTLRFDFPTVAQATYAETIAQAARLSGWEVTVQPAVNQLALEGVARELLPDPNAKFSIHLARGVVEVKLANVPADFADIQARFHATTGFRMILKDAPGTSPAPKGATNPATPEGATAMEINTAYARLRAALEPLGLYKLGLKNGTIVLSFITPEIGERHQAILDKLGAAVGYPLVIHPHPNQHALITLVTNLCQQQGLALKKTPSLQINQRMVTIEPQIPPGADTALVLQQAVLEATAYQLVINAK